MDGRTSEAFATDSNPADAVRVGTPGVGDGELPPVLTVEELAALLRVNRNTAYQAVARGDIPGARRIGRTVRISRDAVLNDRS